MRYTVIQDNDNFLVIDLTSGIIMSKYEDEYDAYFRLAELNEQDQFADQYEVESEEE